MLIALVCMFLLSSNHSQSSSTLISERDGDIMMVTLAKRESQSSTTATYVVLCSVGQKNVLTPFTCACQHQERSSLVAKAQKKCHLDFIKVTINLQVFLYPKLFLPGDYAKIIIDHE